MIVCQCVYRRWPEDRCAREMTEEDGLCDGCRQFHPQSGWMLEQLAEETELIFADPWSRRP